MVIGYFVLISAGDATVGIATSCAQQRNQGLMRALFRGRALNLDRVVVSLSCIMLLLARWAVENHRANVSDRLMSSFNVAAADQPRKSPSRKF
jgi:hypothetical protein